LHQAGYEESTRTARCSFEGSSPDIFAQAAPLITLLKQRYQEALEEV